MEEATDTGLSTKGDEISWSVEVPVLVSPHFSSASNSCLGLVNHKWNTVVKGDLSQLSIEVGSCHLVLESRNRFDNNGSHISLLISSVLNDSLDFIEASILLSLVLMLKLSHGISNLGERSAWPVVGRHTLKVHLLITA